MAETSFTTRLIKKEKNSADAWNFMFEKPSDFTYQAGQYIKMKLEVENPDERGISRYFTLSSSPTDDYLMVTTRILKSTFKLTLGNLKIGETVQMKGPWGDFVLPTSSKKPLVFLAGGIGMTPYHSILRFVAAQELHIPIILFVSYKTPDQILYKEELDRISQENKNISIVTTITEPEGSNWNGLTGRITTELLQKHIANLQNNLYYIAGPDPMIAGTEKMLMGVGVKKEDILTDGFPGYK